jgi:hypothetical protein
MKTLLAQPQFTLNNNHLHKLAARCLLLFSLCATLMLFVAVQPASADDGPWLRLAAGSCTDPHYTTDVTGGETLLVLSGGLMPSSPFQFIITAYGDNVSQPYLNIDQTVTADSTGAVCVEAFFTAANDFGQYGITIHGLRANQRSYNTFTVVNIHAAPEPTDTPTPMPTDPPVLTETPEPTDTPSPEPTDPPAPTATPKPTDTPIPEPVDPPAPTETPEPTNTPEPTEPPGPTSTPEPANTPAPTGTPEPTSIPEPTDTPAPTETPAPTITAAPPVDPGNKSTPEPASEPTLVPTDVPANTPEPAVSVPNTGEVSHQEQSNETDATSASARSSIASPVAEPQPAVDMAVSLGRTPSNVSASVEVPLQTAGANRPTTKQTAADSRGTLVSNSVDQSPLPKSLPASARADLKSVEPHTPQVNVSAVVAAVPQNSATVPAVAASVAVFGTILTLCAWFISRIRR